MFDYIHKSDVIKAQTVTVPRVLFSSQRFQELSPRAKILYAMLREALEDEDTRRKPAYHNGTAWPWPYPSYAEALLLVHGPSARPAAASLLAAALPLLETDCIGHLPEIMDGDAPHTGRGCDAQAWSVSEFLRLARSLGI